MPLAIPRAIPVAIRIACIADAAAISVMLSAARSETLLASRPRAPVLDRFARRVAMVCLSSAIEIAPLLFQQAGCQRGERATLASDMADVLVVEDEPDIRQLIVHHLEREGYRCRHVATGTEALRAVRAGLPDLLVLDLMLPELDGLEVCRRLRADPATAALPIIMLTAKVDEVDRVVGLELGADDYVSKPFSPKELVARVRAVLRRARPDAAARVFREGAIVLDPARHRVTVGGANVELTPKEFELLHVFMEAAGRVLGREHLLSRVWGYAHADEIESRTVDVHVRRLRAKLGDEGGRITTVKSVGYRFERAEGTT
jgi:phosphate regulon transcriptional regulator PhoB